MASSRGQLPKNEVLGPSTFPIPRDALSITSSSIWLAVPFENFKTRPGEVRKVYRTAKALDQDPLIESLVEPLVVVITLLYVAAWK